MVNMGDISAMFSLVSFLNMSTYLIRCQFALAAFLVGRVDRIVDADPPPEDLLYIAALIDYMVSNTYEPGGPSGRRGYSKKRLRHFLEELFSVCNGQLRCRK